MKVTAPLRIHYLGTIIVTASCLLSQSVTSDTFSGVYHPAMQPLADSGYRLTSVKCTPAGSEFLNTGRVAKVKINGAWLKQCISQRFMDQGETVLDRTTGLQWEKKTDDGGIHDKDNLYTWTANTDRQKGPWSFDGTANAQFIQRLNASGACFADHCDWRLPTIDELKGIIDTRRTGCPAELGCIDPALGLTPSVPTESYYWTTTSVSEKPWFAFDSGGFGGVGYNWKDIQHYARAVRGGNSPPAAGGSPPKIVNGCVIASKTKCPNWDLEDADLSGADLVGADLSSANLMGANLTGANLSGANLNRVNFMRANMTSTNLTSSTLVNAWMAHSTLAFADVSFADLTNAYMGGSIGQPYNFYGAILCNTVDWNGERHNRDCRE